MERLTLTRDCSTEIGVFGVVQYEAERLSWFTCEPPWKYNLTYVSCIPAGTYRIYRDTFRGLYPNFRLANVPDRGAIEFHRGNTIRDTSGCILLGTGRGYVGGLWAVTNSAAAMESFMAALDGIDEAELEIKWALNPEEGANHG